MEKPSPVLLLEMLQNLGEDELKLFHFYLQYEPGGDFTKIYKCQLENADRLKTVDVMVQAYSDRVMEVAQSILGRMNKGSPSAQEASSRLSEDALHKCHRKLKPALKKKFQCVFEGIAKAGNPTLLNQIYTELYITEGGTAEVNDEHEVRQIETASRKPDRPETTIRQEDIFKDSPGRDEPIRTVLTKGVAGIGKTVLTQKYTLDWAEDKANQDIQFIFPFTFRELNVLKEEKFSLVELVHHFFTETKEAGICSFEDFQVVFIFDGLDECRLPLDFHKTTILTDPRKSTSVDVLLINLIRGKLLPSARLWITTRPAAANQIPPDCVGMVSEIRGFTDPQKEEYFRKRFRDEEQASRIISHIKTSRSLHIMCHIPVFCWITATVLEDVLETREGGQLPKTLTEMYIHFLVVQAKVKKVKYDGGAETDPHWSPESRKMMESLGKLAFDQLQKGNLIFYESDLTECGIDIRAASVYSGVFTQIFKEERGLYQDKVFCFIHLSVQEFLAALHVHLTFINSGKNLLEEQQTTSKRSSFFGKKESLHQSAVKKALQSPNGHLDLFLRFLLGLSLQTNQTLLRGLLTQTGSSSHTSKKTVEYIKKKLSENLSAEKSINLFHCLNELNDRSLVEEIQQSLRSGSLSTDELSPAQWSALVFILLSSEEDLDVFDLKKYSASEEALLRLLPVVKSCNKALLSGCNLSDRSCDALSSVFNSQSSCLKELDLSDNNLQDSGVTFLSAALQSPHCTLENLSSMPGGNKRKTRGIRQESAEEGVFSPKEVDGASKLKLHGAMEAIEGNILADLKKVQDNLKSEIAEKTGLVKTEMSEFTKEVGQRFDEIVTNMKEVTSRIEEVEQRVTEVEEVRVDLKDVLGHTLQLQEDLQGIQRCHHSLGPKPPPGSNPRSVVIRVLQYKTKDLVLRSAWTKKEILLKGRHVYFDQDHSSYILAKRKACNMIRRILKEKGLRFQTLYLSSLHVFYENGPVIYNNAQDASDGLEVDGKGSGRPNSMHPRTQAEDALLGKSERGATALVDCGLSEISCDYLVAALKSNPSYPRVLHLSVDYNNLQDSGVKQLCVLLENPRCRFETLRLVDCGLSEISCDYLVAALKSNPSYPRVLHLSVDYNNLQDSGVKQLCVLLENPRCRFETLRGQELVGEVKWGAIVVST
ncbi:unnamed protein product [Oreochromis niloticus]|nr:unnamed protein product [Mustela putorius furo]